jgi:hypothetical protein
MARASLVSREIWPTSSISAPARSIVDGMAHTPATTVSMMASSAGIPCDITW